VTDGPRMLVIDTAYTHKMMVERKLSELVTSRDLGGYFDHIWACHPFATLFEPAESPERNGPPTSYHFAAAHTLIEGRIGRFRWLTALPFLNFLVAQVGVLRRLVALVRRERIDLIRCEDPLYNGLLGLLIARLCRKPLIIGVWGNPGAIRQSNGQPLMPRLFRKIRVEEAVERFVLRRADLVLAQNEDNRGFILSKGVPREKTEIFRLGNALNGIHFSDPAEREDGRPMLAELGISNDPTLLVIARLYEPKLIQDVIRAVRLLKDRGRRVTLLLAGEGPYTNLH